MTTKYVLPASFAAVIEFGSEDSDKFLIAALQHDAQVIRDCMQIDSESGDSGDLAAAILEEDARVLQAINTVIEYYGGKAEE